MNVDPLTRRRSLADLACVAGAIAAAALLASFLTQKAAPPVPQSSPTPIVRSDERPARPDPRPVPPNDRPELPNPGLVALPPSATPSPAAPPRDPFGQHGPTTPRRPYTGAMPAHRPPPPLVRPEPNRPLGGKVAAPRSCDR